MFTVRRILFILCLVFLFCGRSHGACSGASPTWTAASGSNTDIQACITVASNGDTILVPLGAGSTAYTAAVNIPASQCVTINGQGATVTNSPAYIINQGTTCSSRVTGFNFTGTSGNQPATDVVINGNTIASRLDHNTFTAAGTQIFVEINSIGSAGQSYPTVIDHNTFNCGYVISPPSACEAIHNEGATNSSSQVGWTNNVVPGGPNMVFIEDNTVNQTGGNNGNQISAVEQFYGAQTVIRHNTFNNCTQVDAHGTQNLTGARWWEIYSNQFNANGFSCPDNIQLRGGSGVVYNNTSDGTSTNSTPCGSSAKCFIDIFNENGSAATWPNEWQPGSGINGNTNSHVSCPGPTNNAPAQFWNNTNMPIGIGGGVPGTILVNRDYIVSAIQPTAINWEEASGDTCSTTYAYTPAPYPNSLTLTFPSASSTIDWTHAGIPGGIPDASWPICQTIPPSGGADDSVTIQNALNSCAAGTVVQLTAGTYTLHRTTGVVCVGKSDDGGGGVYEAGLCVTDKSAALRGAGPQSTIINYGDGANIISIGQTFLSHTGVVFTPITAGATKGSTSITVGTLPAGVVVNSFIVISQTNPTDTDGNPLVQIGGYGGTCSYCGHDLPNNAMDQIDQVTAINGTTMTLARPLYWNYINAPVMYHLPMVVSAGVENLRVVGTAASGTALQYKNINMEACAFCWVHNVESDFAVDVSNFYGSDVYGSEFSNNYAYEAFNHNAGADYSLLLQFRASENLIANNIIRRARHSTPLQGTAGNVFIYNYLINAYEGENHNFLAETQLHAPEPYMNLWEGNVMANSEFGDFAHGSSNDNTFFRNYVNLTAINPDTNSPMTGGLIAMNVAYYSNYENIVGNAFGPYPTGCNASTYETDASTTKVNGVIWQLGYFDDGGGSTPNQALSNKVGATLVRGGNWDCVTGQVIWSNNIPAGSPSQASYLATQFLPNSLVYSSAPSYFTATGAVWPPINTAASTIVNQIPAQICYNAAGGPSSSAGGNFNPSACYTATTGTVTITPTANNFGTVIVGSSSATQSFTITSTLTSSTSLGISNVGGKPLDFPNTNTGTCSTTLAANSSCTYIAKFSPSINGAESTTLTVTDSAGSQTSALSGIGQAPVVVFAPATGLGFGNVIVSNPVMAVDNLKNNGAAVLNITSITASTPFTVYTTCGATLAVGQTCEIAVKYIPTTTGANNGTVTMVDNAPGSPHTFTVTGTGVTGTVPALDQYGGNTAKPCVNITGRFHMERLGTQWTYCTPLGNTFFLHGVYLVDFGQDAGYSTKITAKYGSSTAWAIPTLQRIQSWGFNSAYYHSNSIVQPFATSATYPLDPNGINSIPIKLPFIFQFQPGLYGMQNKVLTSTTLFPTGQMLPIGQSIKNAAVGWPPVYVTPGGFTPPSGEADFFDPNLQVWLHNYLQTQIPNSKINPYVDYVIGAAYDDGDQLYGTGAGPNFTTQPPGLNNPSLGWLTATESPIQVVSSLYPVVYTNTTVFNKQAWQSQLQTKYGTIAALNTAWGSTYTTFGSSGTQRTETIGTGDGTTTTFTHTITNMTASRFTIQILVNGVVVGGDTGRNSFGGYNQNENFVGYTAAPTPVSTLSGTYNSTTGAISITFVTAPASGASITTTFVQNGWGFGTGLMDEDGRTSSQAWLGTSPYTLAGANANTVTDLNAFVVKLIQAYLQPIKTEVNAALPGWLLLGPDSYGSGAIPPSAQVLQGIAGLQDVYTGGVGFTNTSDYQSKLDFVQANLGDMPMQSGDYLTANPDSPYSASPLANTYPTQLARGQAYATQLQLWQGSTFTATGSHPFVAMNQFEFLDIAVQNANFGLVTLLDNAYDGHEDTTASVTCSPPLQAFSCGGQAATYGNYISCVTNANAGNFAACLSSGGAVTFSPTSLTYGTVPQNTSSAAQSATISNTTGSTITYTSLNLSGANPLDFAVSAGTPACASFSGGTLGNGASCQINVTFTPTAAPGTNESATATLSFTGGGTSPITLLLTGTSGTNAAVTITPAVVLAFPNQVPNTTSASQVITVTSSGVGNLVLAATNAVTMSGANPANFIIGANTCTNGLSLAPLATCTINVTFRPNTTGVFNAQINLSDNAPGSPQVELLTGTGAAPAPAPMFATVTGTTAPCISVGQTWLNTAIPLQTGNFEIQFDVIPSASKFDGVLGLAAAPASTFNNLAVPIVFSTLGTIQMLNGAFPYPSSPVTYSAGNKYHITLDVNMGNHTYNGYVGTTTRTQVANNYAWRTAAGGPASLNFLGSLQDSGSGTLTVCNITILAPMQ